MAVGRASSLVPVLQAQDTEIGAEAQKFLAIHILSAYPPKVNTWKVPQEGISREKKE